ncbi:DUF3488 and transglutaminase-like domain-containing protein [uncultured Desulfuromusa sp.]|uniref:transglutaminase family protein n=1 Tax=uncultured Desulfuromusa sp. TaxID=219183 RepID=UPI002AA75672|nr:DUF3488 and transglutaminase-like domain-containing protein [uncultured Desulfuromusa sp.]
MVKIKVPLDILTYLIVALGIAPLFPWLDLSVQGIAIAAFIAGIICDKRHQYWFGSRIATALTILFFTLYGVQLNLSDVVSPAVNVLVLLLSIRLLTEKQGRHYLQIFVLSLFCLAGSSLLSLNIAYLPALILMVTGVTIGLVLLTFFHRDPGLRFNRRQLFTLMKTAVILPVGSLLLMLVLFVLLPRTQYPLWNFLNPKAAAKTGFSEQVRPGAYSSNIADKSVAFRVKIDEIAREDLYWRGTVLNTITGTTWKRIVPQQPGEQTASGKPVSYTVTLPPTNGHFLFTLDIPEKIEGVRHRIENDGVFMANRRLEKSVTYQGQSLLGARLRQESVQNRALYLDVPPALSTRINQAAARIRQQTDSPSQRVLLLEEFFRKQQLVYADTDLPGPSSPIDEFLFDKKRGYCEFFASSFAQLLRLCGIPSRLVGGYHGGEYNNLGGYYLLTEDLAHVWVEAFIDGYWQRLDPSRFAVNAGSALLAPRRQGLSLLKSLTDSLEYVWTQSVLNYDLRQQLSLARLGSKQLKNKIPKAETLKKTVVALGGGILLTVLLCWWWRQHLLSPKQRLLRRYQKKIKACYKLKSIPTSTGLLEFALQLNDPDAIRFARQFNAILYGEHPLTKAEMIDLKGMIDAIGSSRRDN